MAERNTAADEPRIDFRIGINVGDIVMQDDDIFGDGVNIAARLEGIADPGSICVSQRVQEDAVGKTRMTFEDMGEQSLKNINRPVRAFRVKVDGGAAPAVTASREASGLIAGLPDKPSLAVLPFQNMSGDPEQEYFADGVVEDIITSLSRFRSFAVIARNSSFVYKGRAVDVRQVAKDLGVRYLLEGSVRRAGQRLRITAQLIEATSGAHRWADRFEGAVEDIFNVQDRITESVVGVIEPQIRRAEIERARRKRPENLDAYDLYLRGLSKIYGAELGQNTEAYALLMKAIDLEPHHSPFLVAASWTLLLSLVSSTPPLTDDDCSACLNLARRALANAQGDPEVLAYCGNVLANVAHEHERGMRVVANAVEANPNNATVLMWAGIANIHDGNFEQSIAYSQRAMLMSPGDPAAHLSMTAIAHSQMGLANYDKALVAAEQSFAINSSYAPTLWMLIAANAQLGRMDEAKRWLATFQIQFPGVSIANIREGQPHKDPLAMAAILDGLRLAGLDED